MKEIKGTMNMKITKEGERFIKNMRLAAYIELEKKEKEKAVFRAAAREERKK